MTTFNHNCRGSQASKFEQAALKKSGFSLNPPLDYTCRKIMLSAAILSRLHIE
jgi:hypothetical protein